MWTQISKYAINIPMTATNDHVACVYVYHTNVHMHTHGMYSTYVCIQTFVCISIDIDIYTYT